MLLWAYFCPKRMTGIPTTPGNDLPLSAGAQSVVQVEPDLLDTTQGEGNSNGNNNDEDEDDGDDEDEDDSDDKDKDDGNSNNEDDGNDEDKDNGNSNDEDDGNDEDKDNGNGNDEDNGNCQSHSTLQLPMCDERLLALSNPCWTLPVGCSLVHRGRIESTINLHPTKGEVMAMSATTTSLEWPDWGVS